MANVAWAQAHVKKLFTEWAGQPARFAYLPGLRPFECFQISIDPPRAGRVTVSARSVDTNDGSELERLWDEPIGVLALVLEEATEAVRVWANRSPANDSEPPTPAIAFPSSPAQQRHRNNKARQAYRLTGFEFGCGDRI